MPNMIINPQEHSLQLDVLDAAISWFASKTPANWPTTQHLVQYEVNCNTAEERHLAKAVSAWVTNHTR